MTVDRTTDTAGAGSPAPAVPLPGPDAAGPASHDLVPPEARVELDRVHRRWGELPVARAESRMPLLRRLLADLAARSPRLIADHPRGPAGSARADVGDPQSVGVPDLGVGVVADQLAVLVWDAYAAGNGDGIPQLLTTLRRELG